MTEFFEPAPFHDDAPATVINLDAPELRTGALSVAEANILKGLRRKIAHRDFEMVGGPTNDPKGMLRAVLDGGGDTTSLAGATWRQAMSMGKIARAIATFCIEITPDDAETVGTMRILGKAPLVSILGRVAPHASPHLASLVFHEAADIAGPIMARAWHLEPALAAVCGPLHELQPYDDHAFARALALLSWDIDLLMSRGLRGEVPPLARGRAMDILDIPPDLREDAVMAGFVAFEDHAPSG